MVDTLSHTDRSKRMSLVRDRDTAPEMVVRRLTHELGYRFRLHRRDLPGTPDLVFPSRKKIIFVHGCYWHRHDDPDCRLARLPKSRLGFWLPKLEANARRDKRNEELLEEKGWEVLTLWECQLHDRPWLIRRIRAFLD